MSRLEVTELALADSGRQPADDSTDSQRCEYLNDHSQSGEVEHVHEEGEHEDDEDVDDKHDEDEVEQDEENGNLSLGWGAQKQIRYR